MRLGQKIAVAASFVVVAGGGMYEAGQRGLMRERVKAFEAEERALMEELGQLRQEWAQATDRLAQLGDGDEDARREAANVHRLRAEVARLKMQEANGGGGTKGRLETILKRREALKNLAIRFPEFAIPENRMLSEDDWLELAGTTLAAHIDNETGARIMFREVRRKAKFKVGIELSRALRRYLADSGGILPRDISELKPYFEVAIDDAVLRRYEMLEGGAVEASHQLGRIVLAEKAPPDPLHDTRLVFIGTNQLRVMNIP